MRGERAQTWYPIGKVGWLSRHIRDGMRVTAGQLGPLRPALGQPGWLDDATVARIIGVRQDEADDPMPWVLAGAGQLKTVTMEDLPARPGSWLRGAA